MGITANNLQSFQSYHPGELVKEELECRGIKQKDSAKKFVLFHLEQSFKCKAPGYNRVCPVFLEAALKINADLLVRMQTDYGIQVARKDNFLLEKLNNIRKTVAVL